MKIVKKNLRDLVAASYVKQVQDDSPYANLRQKFSPKKLEAFIEGLTETEKEELQAYSDSPQGKRELKDHEAKERRATRERALIRKNRIFEDRFSKLAIKLSKSEVLRKRIEQAKTLTFSELAQALIIFPELLPDGHKAPALALARKHFKTDLSDKEKEYLVYVWSDTSIPVEICYSSPNDNGILNAELS